MAALLEDERAQAAQQQAWEQHEAGGHGGGSDDWGARDAARRAAWVGELAGRHAAARLGQLQAEAEAVPGWVAAGRAAAC